MLGRRRFSTFSLLRRGGFDGACKDAAPWTCRVCGLGREAGGESPALFAICPSEGKAIAGGWAA